MPHRHSLRHVLSWCVQREIFYSELGRIRDEFEKHRSADPATGARLLDAGEARLREFAHPDKYTIPYAVGGSKYARNPPVPPEVHVALNFGREEGTY